MTVAAAGHGNTLVLARRLGGLQTRPPTSRESLDRTGSVAQVGSRRCSRAGCQRKATATLTYVYRDSTAVLGPLAIRAEPHGYDLCVTHAHSLSAPRGWEVIRLAVSSEPEPSTDDLLALADAVREVGLSYDVPPSAPERAAGVGNGIVELGRRGHLTVLADRDA